MGEMLSIFSNLVIEYLVQDVNNKSSVKTNYKHVTVFLY